jgi:hypothetical protein
MGELVPANPTARTTEYWWWIGLAMFLLFPVDLLTTLIAVEQFGLHIETNPLVRWLLTQGLLALTLANIWLAVTAALCCHGILEAIRDATEFYQRSLALSFEVTIGLLLTLGVFIVSNNLLVIVLQESFL